MDEREHYPAGCGLTTEELIQKLNDNYNGLQKEIQKKKTNVKRKTSIWQQAKKILHRI